MIFSFTEKIKINLDNLSITNKSKEEVRKILYNVLTKKRSLKEPIYGIFLIGSARTLDRPRDVDIVIIAGNSPRRHFEFHSCSGGIKIELQYMGSGFLQQLLSNYYWYTGNLSFELGKFAHAYDLCEYAHELDEALNTIRSQLPREITAFMCSFVIGECVCLSETLAKRSSDIENDYCYAAAKYKLSLLEYLAQGNLPDKKTFPFGGLPDNFLHTKAIITQSVCDVKVVESVCADIINNSTLLKRSLSECGKDVIYYPENLVGLNVFNQFQSSTRLMTCISPIVGREF